MLISQLIILPDFLFIFFLFFPSWTEQVPDGIFKWKHLCPLLPTENMLREKVCGSTKIGWGVKGRTKGISGNIDENRQELRRTKAMHERININCPPIHICPFNRIWSFSNYFLLTSYWKSQIWFLFLVKSRSIALSRAINLNIFFVIFAYNTVINAFLIENMYSAALHTFTFKCKIPRVPSAALWGGWCTGSARHPQLLFQSSAQHAGLSLRPGKAGDTHSSFLFQFHLLGL